MSNVGYPRGWKEMSFDFRLVIVLFGIFLLLPTGALPIFTQGMLYCGALGVLVVLSVVHRIRTRWRRPRIGLKELCFAVLPLGSGGLFLVASTYLIGPSRVFFWDASIVLISLFDALVALKLVYYSKADYLAHCGDAVGSGLPDVVSKRLSPLRILIYSYFVIAWLTGMAFFWQFGAAYSAGTPQPAAERTERLVSHGQAVFITPEESRRVSALKIASALLVPSAILLALCLKIGERSAEAEDKSGDSAKRNES